MSLLAKILMASLLLALAMILGEISLTHVSENVKRATDLLKEGALSGSFWGLAVGLGNFLPIVLLLSFGLQDGGAYSLLVWASLFALAGLWIFEALWIKAGQAVPLS